MKIDSKKPEQEVCYIQEFGSIIILDPDLYIIGISEQALEDFDIADSSVVLDNPIKSLEGNVFGKHTARIFRLVENVRDHILPRQIIPLKFDDKRIYVKISLHHDLVYVEWEQQFKKSTSPSEINEFSFLLDTIQPNNWDLVCQAINRILHFDHVFVLQVHETGYSQVIAENTADGKHCYKGTEFSKSFMPKEVFPFYSMCSYRYSPNLLTDGQKFFGSLSSIALLESQLAPVPELHQAFLSQKGIISALFFSITIDNKFWGLLIAHHSVEKNVDLQQRKLCTFAIQNATSKYESHLNQSLLERYEQLKTAEVELKIDLHKSKTINCALVRHMDTLMNMVDACGFAVFNQGDVSFNGCCPSKSQLYEIINFIKGHTEKSLFKDNNFRLSHGDKISGSLPFAGLMYLKVGLLNDHILIWFRKESARKVMTLERTLESNGTSGKMGVTTDESISHDIALPWNDFEINFVLKLNQILKESMVAKMKDKQVWNEQLLASNNELEMLTHTLSHDLKNPLSILKLGIQFLQNHIGILTAEALQKWYSNLVASAESIEDIISNIVLLSKQKSSALTKEPIPMAYNIQQIFADNTTLFKDRPYEVVYGKILPVWGEKSALYQVFTNVIGNAIKYSAVSQIANIHINSTFEDEYVCYIIQDNGIGIPKENLSHIYEIFKRGSNVQNIEGTGVGLSLVKRIMERLGGSIKIESEENRGTTVMLFFPIVEEFPPSMLED